MNKLVMSVAAAIALSATSAFAADVMPVKAAKVVAPAPEPSPFDIAFGAVIQSDYNFRGVSQSNRGPSVGAYVEPQFNTAFGTLYVGLAGYSIDWPTAYGFSSPTAEIDFYGGWRKTWGAFSLDLGVLYYYYPREQLGIDSDFIEFYAKASYAVTPDFTLGASVFYTPDVLNYGQFPGISDVSGLYLSGTAKWVTPWKAGDLGLYISGELAHWFLDNVIQAPSGASVDPSYTYWNIGAALTYKAFTLDFRYHGTDMDRRECADFLLVTVANPASKWCGDTFIAALKFDTTLSALK